MQQHARERWRDILQYEGVYQVSDIGNIRRLLKNGKTRMLCVITRKDRYMAIGLWKNGVGIIKTVHRLVLEAFIGRCPKGMECRHLDGNRQNNQLCNLKWGTRSENGLDAVKHGTRFYPDTRGSKQGQSKLTEKDIMEIFKLLDNGETQKEIAEKFGVHQVHISRIKRRVAWKHMILLEKTNVNTN